MIIQFKFLVTGYIHLTAVVPKVILRSTFTEAEASIIAGNTNTSSLKKIHLAKEHACEVSFLCDLSYLIKLV